MRGTGHLLVIGLAAALGASCGRTPIDAGAGADGGDPLSSVERACGTASDCGWGEIDREILSARDCICLFGCPYLPLSQNTIARRQAQYAALCTPGRDGTGRACPVDDCAQPLAIACRNGACSAPLGDASVR